MQQTIALFVNSLDAVLAPLLPLLYMLAFLFLSTPAKIDIFKAKLAKTLYFRALQIVATLKNSFT